MSNKKVEKHPVAHEVNNVAPKKTRAEREQKQKDQGEVVIKWIAGVLFILAIAYVIWSFYIVQ